MVLPFFVGLYYGRDLIWHELRGKELGILVAKIELKFLLFDDDSSRGASIIGNARTLQRLN